MSLKHKLLHLKNTQKWSPLIDNYLKWRSHFGGDLDKMKNRHRNNFLKWRIFGPTKAPRQKLIWGESAPWHRRCCWWDCLSVTTRNFFTSSIHHTALLLWAGNNSNNCIWIYFKDFTMQLRYKWEFVYKICTPCCGDL